MDSYIALFALLTVIAVYKLLGGRRGPSIKNIPGPPSSSFLYGNLIQLLLPDRYGKYEFEWQKQFGPVYRIKGCFSEDRLVISDPVTLKYVLNDPTFERSVQQQEIVNMLIGKKTVFYVKGHDHRRIRNIMNAAFAPSSIRALPPLFNVIGQKLIDRWESMIIEAQESGKKIIDVYHSIHDATLDGVGAGAIGYEFGAMDNQASELGQSHQNIITMSGVMTKMDILFEAIVPLIPQRVLQALFSLPTPAFQALSHNREISARVSKELVERQQENVALGIEPGKDLLHVMVRSNASAKASHRLSNEEMQQQIPSLMIAGQDTTGNTLSMALYELSKDPGLQETVRKELIEATAANNGELNFSTVESLPFFNAFLKEVLRLHPGLPMSDRVATCDSVLPLSKPIISTNGERLQELHISKGQHIIIASASFNRLQSVWGQDADKLKPSRWFENDPSKEASFGPYAGLGTFLGGPRVCIGWKFAITELQTLLPALIKRFKFKLADNVDITPRLAVTLAPVAGERFCLPLIVETVEY